MDETILFDDFTGRIIAAKLVDSPIDQLILMFDDGRNLKIWDDASYCCEHRYTTTDDDLMSLVGGRLLRIEVKDGPDVKDAWNDHNTQFVEVITDRGFVTLVNHNEHNGYYAGFDVAWREM